MEKMKEWNIEKDVFYLYFESEIGFHKMYR